LPISHNKKTYFATFPSIPKFLIEGEIMNRIHRMSVTTILQALSIALFLFSTTQDIHSQSFVSRWGSLPPGNSEFKNPFGIAIDISGKILVVDSGNHRVQVFNANGDPWEQVTVNSISPWG
jgi:hypothetical protein